MSKPNDHTARQPRSADWLSVDDARERILSRVPLLGIERIGIGDALGRVLATDVESRIAHPAWDNSAMDGFAVRSDDVAAANRESPVLLRVVDEVPAGEFPTRALRGGEAIRVMTGAPVPEGADGVIRIEHTEPGPEPVPSPEPSSPPPSPVSVVCTTTGWNGSRLR